MSRTRSRHLVVLAEDLDVPVLPPHSARFPGEPLRIPVAANSELSWLTPRVLPARRRAGGED